MADTGVQRNDQGKYVCPDCGREFTSPQGVGSHRARAHGYRNPARALRRTAQSQAVIQRAGNGPGKPVFAREAQGTIDTGGQEYPASPPITTVTLAQRVEEAKAALNVAVEELRDHLTETYE